MYRIDLTQAIAIRILLERVKKGAVITIKQAYGGKEKKRYKVKRIEPNACFRTFTLDLR